MIIIYGLLILIVISSVELIRPLESNLPTKREQDAALRSLLSLILAAHSRRRLNQEALAKARGLYKKITKNMSKPQIKKWLRQDEASPDAQDVAAEDNEVNVIESELKNALTQHKAAIYERPYVEKRGKNDFLVMKPEVSDPLVTALPNNIYYNIEKKCVNWLDDCSLKGIKARLLRGVRSP